VYFISYISISQLFYLCAAHTHSRIRGDTRTHATKAGRQRRKARGERPAGSECDWGRERENKNKRRLTNSLLCCCRCRCCCCCTIYKSFCACKLFSHSLSNIYLDSASQGPLLAKYIFPITFCKRRTCELFPRYFYSPLTHPRTESDTSERFESEKIFKCKPLRTYTRCDGDSKHCRPISNSKVRRIRAYVLFAADCSLGAKHS